MKSIGQLPGGQIHDFALSCYDIVKSTPSKQSALNMIADFASPHLKEYFIATLKNPDEITMNFIDLLDQIIFEIAENIHFDDPVHEYIIEDLYARLGYYLDIFRGRETYIGNANKRIITHEDTIIIRQHHIAEFVPVLITEYFEQPILRKPILRALIAFGAEDLLNLYYNIAKDEACIEEKILALIGLKRFGSKFNFSHLHSPENAECAGLIEYAESFDCNNLVSNVSPRDIYMLLFSLNYVEFHVGPGMDVPVLTWILRILQPFLRIDYCGMSIADFYRSVSNIFLFTCPDILGKLLHDEELTIALIRVLDFFPGEFFYKLAVKLSLVRLDFIRAVNHVTLRGKIELNEYESNTMNYVMWESGNNL
jgi:hypothetical protein